VGSLYALVVEYGPDSPVLPVRWLSRELPSGLPGYGRRLARQADGNRRLVEVFLVASSAAVEPALGDGGRQATRQSGALLLRGRCGNFGTGRGGTGQYAGKVVESAQSRPSRVAVAGSTPVTCASATVIAATGAGAPTRAILGGT
jgi:hypothetical protein